MVFLEIDDRLGALQPLRDNKRLTQRLERAEAIIDLQKNHRGTRPAVGIETAVLS